ncbi:hypothetical protein RB195_018659 [Necator americanus]|uniref:Uncharacterized protein n=1 Tax=Necator americanus TaxID=51031 RepID=A0ABR1CCM1_NECAM
MRDEDRIIRHHPRLPNAPFPYDTKSPIYNPDDSELFRLIVQDHPLCFFLISLGRILVTFLRRLPSARASP